jgi:predicted small secreted protein/copper chaperone CopZ
MVGTLAVLMPRRVLAAVAVLAAAPALAGCTTAGSGNDSSGDFKGEARLVANVVEDLQSAGSKGREGDICTNLLARSLAVRIGARANSCAKAVNAALEDTDVFDLKVESVRVQGTRATARVKADRGDRDEFVTLGLVKSGPGWRISDLG